MNKKKLRLLFMTDYHAHHLKQTAYQGQYKQTQYHNIAQLIRNKLSHPLGKDL